LGTETECLSSLCFFIHFFFFVRLSYTPTQYKETVLAMLHPAMDQ
jgi:hypothetical protein